MKQLYISFLCVLFITYFSACNQSTAPQTTIVPTGTTGQLKVIVDGGTCMGSVSNVVISIDGSVVGTVRPGGSVVMTENVGNHIVTATSPGTTGWGPITCAVTAGQTTTQELTCSGPVTGQLKVMVDASSCAGNASNIAISIDGSLAGTVQPGGSVTSTVSAGNHSVSARSQENEVWAPTNVSVIANQTQTATLTCPYQPPPPTKAVLRVYVDGNCSNKASNVVITIDGLTVGTVQPGATGVSETLSIGDHTISAISSQGVTWNTVTVSVPAGGYSYDLYCN